MLTSNKLCSPTCIDYMPREHTAGLKVPYVLTHVINDLCTKLTTNF